MLDFKYPITSMINDSAEHGIRNAVLFRKITRFCYFQIFKLTEKHTDLKNSYSLSQNERISIGEVDHPPPK
jgi:hypothetical protein